MRLLRRFPVPTSVADLATTERLLGRPATPFASFARRVAAEHGVLAEAPARATATAPGSGSLS